MLSDASLVSGDSNAPAGGRAVVLRRHHHLRSVTSPQAPSPLPPSPSARPPFPPSDPLSKWQGGQLAHHAIFAQPLLSFWLDLLLFFSSGHLLIISFSPMFFSGSDIFSTCCFQQTLIFTQPFLRLHANWQKKAHRSPQWVWGTTDQIKRAPFGNE